MAAQKKRAAKKAGDGAAAEAATLKAAPKTAAKSAAKRSKPVKGAEAFAPADEAARTARDALEATTIETIAAPAARLIAAGADQAREAYARAQEASEQLRQTMAETTTATTRGAVEINGKVIDAWRAQGEIALGLWRQALAAGSVSEAVRLQTSGARHAYETAAAHWKDVAETTTRWLGESVKPLRSALSDDAR